MLILAYDAFRSFLDGPLTWTRYEQTVLASHRALRTLHMNYGLMDLQAIQRMVESIDRDKYRRILAAIDPPFLEGTYKSTVSACDALLKPLTEIDVYLFLAVLSDCLCITVDERKVAMISLEYSGEPLPKIIAHEYAHILHLQRKPDLSGVKGALVSEGIACYLLRLTNRQSGIHDALWMMNADEIRWCRENEKAILEALNDCMTRADKDIYKKFFIGGKGFADPPKGFPEKSGYYIGYRIIENVLEHARLQDVISLDAESIIDRSGISLLS